MDLLSLIARNVIVMEGTMASSMSVHNGDTNGGDTWRASRDPMTSLHRRSSSAIMTGGKNTGLSTSLQRRYSVGDLREHGRESAAPCYLQRQSSLSDVRNVSWSEYTARRSMVKFRNRHSATYRSRDQFGGGIPPSKMAVRVLCNQYEICRNKNTKISERIMAVFYCWFFGWITDVYSFLTCGCVEKSFFKWMVSSLLVTVGATVLVGLVGLLAHGLLVFLARILHSAVTFLAFLTVIFLMTIGTVTILSYSKFHHSQSRHYRPTRSTHKAIQFSRS